jgi:hypothetical protein
MAEACQLHAVVRLQQERITRLQMQRGGRLVEDPLNPPCAAKGEGRATA